LQFGLWDVLWCDKIKYLGMHIVCDKCFKLDTFSTVRKFYAAANSIHSHTKYVQELSLLSSLESFTNYQMVSAVFAVERWLDGWMSHAGIVSERLIPILKLFEPSASPIIPAFF